MIPNIFSSVSFGVLKSFVQGGFNIQWKLDLADTDLAENLDLKDTRLKIGATIFDF